MAKLRTLDTRLATASITLKNWWEFAFGWRRLDIAPSDLVLEIGSGQKPMPRSDVLCDKFFFDGAERGGNRLALDRPLVIGDAQRLPFKDKAFDFAYTSHLIEHVDRPERFCAELIRVAKRGFITCPSEFAEKFIGWDIHRWFVRTENGTLILTQKDRPIYDMTFTAFCHDQQRLQDGAALSRFVSAYGELFWISFAWDGSFEYQVHYAPQRAATGWTVANTEHPGHSQGSTETISLKRKMASLWGRGVCRLHSRKAFVLADLLACPACRASLVQRDDSTLVCESCSTTFPVLDGVPFLLEPANRPCVESAV